MKRKDFREGMEGSMRLKRDRDGDEDRNGNREGETNLGKAKDNKIAR